MERFYEVLVADYRYHSDKPLTYRTEQDLNPLQLVSVPIRNRTASAFVYRKVKKPNFITKPITAVHSAVLPAHYLKLAEWVAGYYNCDLSDSLRLFSPSGAAQKRSRDQPAPSSAELLLGLTHRLTTGQSEAIKKIQQNPSHTVLLHGDTGSGKTRVYLELAAKALGQDRSVLLLTPEISLTSQLAQVAKQQLKHPIYVLHSQQTPAQRRKLWLAIANATEPVVVIGPRSALFSPIKSLGLIVVDEAHEPAYKQDQTPRYHTARVASQLAKLVNAKVVLGTATPTMADYYLAKKHNALVTLKARQNTHPLGKILVDLRDQATNSSLPYLSTALVKALDYTLNNQRQAMIYLNRRGSARLTLCTNCGWRLTCPRCDIPMVYHADRHESACHTCGTILTPPVSCPSCGNPEVIYKSAGTKALAEILAKAYPNHKVSRFDSDNQKGETVNELYKELKSGQIDILVGTQLLAKGLDLPKLGLVGVINADTSLNLPDFTAGERTFQLLYQVIGRVGRGHGSAEVVVQSYDPDNSAIKAAFNKDYPAFYESTLKERQKFTYPPFAYLMKLTCKRASNQTARQAAINLRAKLVSKKLPVEIIGPTPSFTAKRSGAYYWQLVLKSKERSHLVALAKLAKNDWSVDLDPIDLL